MNRLIKLILSIFVISVFIHEAVRVNARNFLNQEAQKQIAQIIDKKETINSVLYDPIEVSLIPLKITVPKISIEINNNRDELFIDKLVFQLDAINFNSVSGSLSVPTIQSIGHHRSRIEKFLSKLDIEQNYIAGSLLVNVNYQFDSRRISSNTRFELSPLSDIQLDLMMTQNDFDTVSQRNWQIDYIDLQYSDNQMLNQYLDYLSNKLNLSRADAVHQLSQTYPDFLYMIQSPWLRQLFLNANLKQSEIKHFLQAPQSLRVLAKPADPFLLSDFSKQSETELVTAIGARLILNQNS